MFLLATPAAQGNPSLALGIKFGNTWAYLTFPYGSGPRPAKSVTQFRFVLTQ